MIKKKLIIKDGLVFKRYTLDTPGENLCDGCSKLVEGSFICSLGLADFDFCCKIGFAKDHLIYRYHDKKA
jgi:hypothetical protein